MKHRSHFYWYASLSLGIAMGITTGYAQNNSALVPYIPDTKTATKASVPISSTRSSQTTSGFMGAKPIQTGEKSSTVIGNQRTKSAAAAQADLEKDQEEPKKKKSKTKAALKAVGQAVPAVIEYGPKLVQSGKTMVDIVQGAPKNAQPASNPKEKKMTGRASENENKKKDLSNNDDDDEENDDEVDDEDDASDNYEYLKK